MKKVLLLLLGYLSVSTSSAQNVNNQKIIALAKTYKDYMFRNEAGKEVLKEIRTTAPDDFKVASEFIAQSVTTKNKLLSQPFLSRPENAVLKQIYIIRAVNLNIRDENQIDNNKLIDSLSSMDIPVYEMVDNYYEMLFTGVGNKNQPFNLSKVDLQLKDYNLKDDTEKGILVLEVMDFCGTSIWGYMNIPKPPNTTKAYEYIKKFPKINGRPYYQYTDFYFPDFEMVIIKDKGKQSYKGYYLNKFFETLLNHYITLFKQNRPEKEKNDLLLGSILKERNLYKYTEYKESLEGLLKTVDKD